MADPDQGDLDNEKPWFATDATPLAPRRTSSTCRFSASGGSISASAPERNDRRYAPREGSWQRPLQLKPGSPLAYFRTLLPQPQTTASRTLSGRTKPLVKLYKLPRRLRTYHDRTRVSRSA